MSEFNYHVYYRPGFKLAKPNGLTRRLVEEKYEMDTDFFDEGQLLDLKNDNVGKEEDTEDVELEGIDVTTWEKKNGLCVVPQEHGLEVLCHHQGSEVAEQCREYQTEELVSRNFTWDKWSENVA